MTEGGTSLLGTTVRRVEDPDLLVGRSTFVDNDQAPDLLHAAFVRSPVGHATITGVEAGAALRAPGVVAVLTAADLGGRVVPPVFGERTRVPRQALAADRVRYVGDPVALVVATSRAQAVDAVELVDVDLAPLPAVTDMEAALAPDAPQLFEDLPGNVAGTRFDDEPGEPWPADAHVVRLRMENQRMAAAPMEGHAIAVRPHADGRLTVHVGTQTPHRARDMVCLFTDLPPEQVRVVMPHVGGGFGGKAGLVAEHFAVVGAARLLGRPVKWAETRSETLLSMQSRGQVQYVELGVGPDGRFLGLRARVVGDGGAYAGFGGRFATDTTRTMAQGVYDIPALRYSGIAAVTNTAPTGAFRGAGRPEATAMIERIVDCAAHDLGLLPEEIRRRNLVPKDAFPYRTRTGATYDVGDYDLALREALRLADVAGARAEQQRRRESGAERQLGIGIATYVEITGFGGTEEAAIEVHRDGSATVRCGTASGGQGHATAFVTMVSDRLGIPADRIDFVQGDTDAVPTGGGTQGSRSLQLGGSAVSGAATEVLDRARAVAGRLLEVSPDDVELRDGGFAVRGVPDVGVGWPEVAAEAHTTDGGLAARHDFSLDGASTYPFGAHVSIVEVDTATGHVTPLRHVAVDDCGTVLNPALVQSQQHGGALQGMSQALWEGFVYAADGTPLTATFVDYAMPTAADALFFETANTETPTPLNPLGAKGIGESATIGATPAVQNAVVDAVSHLGVRHIDLPCTPERVWRAIEQARAGTLPEPWREPPAAFDRA